MDTNNFEDQLISFEQGQVVLKEGDVPDNIYLIKKGYATIISNYGTDKEKSISVLSPGETFGELGIILQSTRLASVIAKTDLELEIINPEILSRVFETPLGKKLEPVIQSMAERIRINGIKLSETGYDYYLNSNSQGNSIELIAVSEVALKFLQGKESVIINKFPFKVGRYSPKRSDVLFHKNDLYLVEQEPYVLSLSNFSITYENGVYYYNDHSNIGSIVNNEKIGGLADDTIQRVELKPGENLLYLGKEHYNILFKIVI